MELKVIIPYVPALSKNRRYLSKYAKFKNPEHTAIQNIISYKFGQLLHSNKMPEKQKVIVNIVWYRSNMRGDCSNFINPICDAIKRVLEFDDNWFAGSWNWFIDTENPRIEISINYI